MIPTIFNVDRKTTCQHPFLDIHFSKTEKINSLIYLNPDVTKKRFSISIERYVIHVNKMYKINTWLRVEILNESHPEVGIKT